MNGINGVTSYPVSINKLQGSNVINFRADDKKTNPIADVDSMDFYVNKDYQKQKKKTNREKNISMALSAFIAATFGVMAYVTIKQSGMFGKKVQQAIAKDVIKEKSIEELSLSKEMKK